ncbi:MAG: MarR family transcriptional regulator [Bacteroidota bacterium]
MKKIPPALDDAMPFNVYRLALLFRRELMDALSEYKLTPEQWQVMRVLWEISEPLNQNDIAHITLRDRHTTSRIVARLQRDGWVTKTVDPNDARASLITLTASAEKVKAEVPAKLIGRFEPIFELLEEEESKQFLSTLKKLRSFLEA